MTANLTQTEAVIALLRTRGEEGLTPLEALRSVGTFRLAARVHDAKALIRDDEEIVTLRAQLDGKVVARYVLRRRQLPQGAWQEAFPW